MKCLIFSDSHGRWDYMERAVRAETPDRVIHLGDVVRDAGRLAEIFPDLEIQQVRGNCDGAGCGFPEERELFLDGRRLWLLHGHSYYVKMGLGMLVEEARARGGGRRAFWTYPPARLLFGRTAVGAEPGGHRRRCPERHLWGHGDQGPGNELPHGGTVLKGGRQYAFDDRCGKYQPLLWRL